MQQSTPARLLRVHISELDRLNEKPLYEAIVTKCREMKIAGATVLRGLEGYGGSTEMHKGHVVRNDRPILISIVDTAENIERLIPEIEQMIDTGMMAASDVQMIRVRKKPVVHEGTGA
jgi:PII-like signaling protein